MANGGFLNVCHLLLPVESILNMLIFYGFLNHKKWFLHESWRIQSMVFPQGFLRHPPVARCLMGWKPGPPIRPSFQEPGRRWWSFQATWNSCWQPVVSWDNGG